MKHIVLIGISHKTAPVELRERLAFAEAALPGALRALTDIPLLGETLILSTCNRVELVGVTDGDAEAALNAMRAFLASERQCPPDQLGASLYQLADLEAIRHVFRVVSSLDSMVVGEPQITGQAREALAHAQSAGVLGHTLHSLMNRAFSTARKIRTETGIGASAVSISYVAVELARKVFDELDGKTVLLVGAGEMAELAAKHLMTNGAHRLLITSRTFENAARLADEMQGTALPFENLTQNIAAADIVLCSTGAAAYLIRAEHMRLAMEARRNNPVFLIDISVPRNIDPAISHLDNVFVFDIDDLQTIARENREQRLREAARAEEIATAEAARFLDSLAEGDLNAVIGAFRREMGELAFAELERSRKRLGDLSPEQEQALRVMINAIVNKFTNPVIKELRESEDGHSPYLKAFREFYQHGEKKEK
ncbi:MAG: glutamyl-tRNA reductase [Blastocatellia bacterium]